MVTILIIKKLDSSVAWGSLRMTWIAGVSGPARSRNHCRIRTAGGGGSTFSWVGGIPKEMNGSLKIDHGHSDRRNWRQGVDGR